MSDRSDNSDSDDDQDELVWPFDGLLVKELLDDPLIYWNPIQRQNVEYVWRCIISSDPYPDRSPEVEHALAVTSTLVDLHSRFGDFRREGKNLTVNNFDTGYFPYEDFHIIFAQPRVRFHLAKCPHCGQSNGGAGSWFDFRQDFCGLESSDHHWTCDGWLVCHGKEYFDNLETLCDREEHI